METTVSTPITERVKTFEDACQVAGVDPKSYESPEGASDEDRHLTSYRKLLLVIRVLNEGWVPDFANSSQWKYWPWFVYTAGSGFSYLGYAYDHSASTVGARLCFKSRELAKYAATQFQELYNEYLTLQN
jgi:hypothetical protein